ncbi:hypothetical protein PanWU01x14_155100, partial [Parasponia andersonii]
MSARMIVFGRETQAQPNPTPRARLGPGPKSTRPGRTGPRATLTGRGPARWAWPELSGL